jgi:hypothetical protein
MSQDSNYRDPNSSASETTSSTFGMTSRVVGGVVRSSDAVSNPSTAAEAIPYADLSTARTSSHVRVSDPKAITGDDILMVDGSETTVAVALLNGWLVRDSNSGLLRSPTQADGDQRQQGDDANKQQQDDANKQQQDDPTLLLTRSQKPS